MNMQTFYMLLALTVFPVTLVQAIGYTEIPLESTVVTQGGSDQGPEETRGQSGSGQQN